MQYTSKIPVLIIGAGPTGLMAAAQLERFGIPYKIIEKRAGTTKLSKALAVQSRTLEIYEQMGIWEKAKAKGIAGQRMNVMVKGKEVQNIPLADIGTDFTAFPYTFILEQSANEALLYEYIQERGGEVLWNTEMTALQLVDDQVLVTIQNENGATETILADWVIAADGGKSPVRHALEIPFKGDTYKNIFYVVDTDVDWDKPRDELHINLTDNNFTAFFPIKDDSGKRYRLVGLLPEEYETDDAISFDVIKKSIREIQYLDLDLGAANWFSTYKVHHRCMESFRYKCVFFAGDAAHVHSPAGGQGMNTGLQDAYNLVWKLALVIQQRANSALLDTYHNERWPIADQLVNSTDRAFDTMVKKGKLINWFRLNILPLLAGHLMGFQSIQQKAFRIISQTGIKYPDSKLSSSSIYLPPKAAHPGDRLPYLHIFNEQSGQLENLYHQLHPKRFNLLVWLSNKDQIADKDAIKLQKYIQQAYPDLFELKIIRDRTENLPAFKQLQLKSSLVQIVRPDNYLGYIGRVDDLKSLDNYLNSILTSAMAFSS